MWWRQESTPVKCFGVSKLAQWKLHKSEDPSSTTGSQVKGEKKSDCIESAFDLPMLATASAYPSHVHITFFFKSMFIFILCIWMFCLRVYMGSSHMPGAGRGQQRAPAHLELVTGVVSLCGSGDLNSGSLQEQQVLLTTEPSLQPSKRT